MPRLSAPVDELQQLARGLSRSDNFLVRLSIDLWCEQGEALIVDLFDLDCEVFDSVLDAMRDLRGGV